MCPPLPEDRIIRESLLECDTLWPPMQRDKIVSQSKSKSVMSSMLEGYNGASIFPGKERCNIVREVYQLCLEANIHAERDFCLEAAKTIQQCKIMEHFDVEPKKTMFGDS
mmetsp:Transcript_15189/g.31044  ORF Transcript_15189/g.31044 Transcript_15189/m.31044 type:complete len:110 (-) Transcript_15189:161-490(-)|eukprot:CAMPEP_0183307940 /NCGR_PEP_ID=MMETSP0160_2-20130417/19648_1 /TAXON_ID=2839 ORGANISM="Odontella Sinensis, Strain Grunow 1884" /NCGR_SAMPLE_ID=MMETSP0160_2 /ASSEMBLY_ACC=CAM_ASM_000250 /LENGTH=109 /DNA_ID=CAMNT_0025471663 /DNA_START=70 /DNA_END=399 /DNA_ORIENTATION=-